MDETPTRRRRWYRFSLRTMLVLVTLLCIYLGWAMNWIRQRHAFVEAHPEYVWSASAGPVPLYDPWPAPWSLRVLGETGIFYAELEGRGDLEVVKRLFPEAAVRYTMPLEYSPAPQF